VSLLDEIVTRVQGLPADRLKLLHAETDKALGQKLWVPNPGPQTLAYLSLADVLGFGGEPGGGKSQLGLGLAFNEHQRSLIMRRQYTDLAGLIDDAIKINGGRDGFNGSIPPTMRRGGKIIEFGAARYVGDEQNWMGRAHDLLVFDEGTQFAYTQVRFLMGWLRHEDPKQRTRVVIPTNPPLTSEGLWFVEMFAPWLDDRYPRPAKPGELRWYVSDEQGRDIEVDGPEPVKIGDKLVQPLSRTFIPSTVDDNPFYAAGSYRAKLDAMTEPHRSILLGKFKTTLSDQPDQVIPTQWIREAQKRWTPKPPDGVPMCALGVDCSGGGADPMVIAIRYDGWYAPMVEIEGKNIPMDRSGAFCAGQVVSCRRDHALVVVDLGGGYGGPTYEHLREQDIDTHGFRGAEACARRSQNGNLHFPNKRSAAYWLFREALDPGQPGGSPIGLPEDPKLIADLAAPTFSPTPHGIRVEPKEDVVGRLGRSTDRGDAVVMAWFEGPKEINSALEWAEEREARRGRVLHPKMVQGARKPLTRR